MLETSLNLLKTIAIATLVAGSAPLPALAQTWPASVVAAAPRMLPGRPFVVVRNADRDVRRRNSTRPIDPASRPPALLALSDEAPQVEVRPKAEWSDDQGWRATPTRIAFKRRF